MEITITPHPLCGSIEMIASKSQAHRLLICAALSDTKTALLCNESSEDIDATARCLSALGASVLRTEDGFSISPIAKKEGEAVLDCGESGSTLRFILPVVGALGKQAKLRLAGRLPRRPLSPLWEELCDHGMQLSWANETILACEGQLQSGAYTLPANISSQFISGLLFALPLLPGDSTLTLTGKIESAQYIAMTEAALKCFGIQFNYKENTYYIPGGQVPSYKESETLRAEGDWSNAAFWLVAGALGEGVTCEGLNTLSLQGDRAITSLLEKFGAVTAYGEEAVSAKNAPLHGIEIDASQIPDLVPILAVCAAAAEGTTRIRGAERLRIKESDRLQTVSEMLSSLGASVRETEDGLIIEGGKPLTGGTVDSAGDHRIAMSAAVCSMLCSGTVTVLGAQAVNKSYPKFWEHFSLLGGQIERRETP